MSLPKTVQDALNDQVGREFCAAYLYLSMAAYCTAQNLPGFAHWMQLQAKEEMGHGMKIYGFIEDRAGRVTLQAIGQPPSEFKSPPWTWFSRSRSTRRWYPGKSTSCTRWRPRSATMRRRCFSSGS